MPTASDTNAAKDAALRYVTPALWVAVAARYALLFQTLPRRARDWNFDLYYVSGLASLKGIDPARTDIAPLGRSIGCHFPDRYFANATPFFRLIFAALAHLSLAPAFWLWNAAGALALVGAGAFLLRMPGGRRPDTLVFFALLLLWPPTIECLWYGEAELLVLFLLAGALWCLTRDLDTAAGMAIGLAALLKAYPALLGGYLLATRRYRALVSATLTGIAGLMLAVSVLGPGSLSGFLFQAHETFGWSFWNLSLSGFLTRNYWRLFTVYSPQAPLEVLTLGAQLAVLLVAFIATWKRSADDFRCYGLWVVAAVMDSPVVWLAYLVLLSIPFATLWATSSAPRRSTTAAVASIALVFLMAPLEPYFLDSRLWHLLSEGEFLALACAYACAYWLVRGSGSAVPEARMSPEA